MEWRRSTGGGTATAAPPPDTDMMRTLTALIVDDEPLARGYLRHMLEDHQNVRVVGEAESATQAIQLAEDLRPDLLFLDIHMPGLTGLQLAEALQQSASDALLIFVTGYSEFAARAFDHAALDYLLKPVSPARLAKTLVRARERAGDAAARAEAARRLAEQTASEASSDEAMRLRRLPIRKDYAVLLVRVEEIVCAAAREKRVFVRTRDGGEHRTYYTLTQLESLLPPDLFLRVHDSCVLNLTTVEEVLLLGNHSYAVRLSNGDQLPVSRSRYALLQERLGLKESLP